VHFEVEVTGAATARTGLTLAGEPDPSGQRVLVTVADSGPGIRTEHLARIFEPFFTTKAEGQGTGLGLAICRRISESHGGRISVDSQPGQGTRVTVTVPTAATHANGQPDG